MCALLIFFFLHSDENIINKMRSENRNQNASLFEPLIKDRPFCVSNDVLVYNVQCYNNASLCVDQCYIILCKTS